MVGPSLGVVMGAADVARIVGNRPVAVVAPSGADKGEPMRWLATAWDPRATTVVARPDYAPAWLRVFDGAVIADDRERGRDRDGRSSPLSRPAAGGRIIVDDLFRSMDPAPWGRWTGRADTVAVVTHVVADLDRIPGRPFHAGGVVIHAGMPADAPTGAHVDRPWIHDDGRARRPVAVEDRDAGTWTDAWFDVAEDLHARSAEYGATTVWHAHPVFRAMAQRNSLSPARLIACTPTSAMAVLMADAVADPVVRRRSMLGGMTSDDPDLRVRILHAIVAGDRLPDDLDGIASHAAWCTALAAACPLEPWVMPLLAAVGRDA